MKSLFFIFTLLLSTLVGKTTAQEATSQATDTSTSISFTPPTNWKAAEASQLSPRVKIMLVGTSSKGFAPSINLATENYTGTLAEYLKIVKSINDNKGNSWKNLGSIQTEAGLASLSQVEAKSQWGQLKMMHVMLLKEGVLYIMTASALADEFSSFYQDFFKSFKSLKINPEITPKAVMATH